MDIISLDQAITASGRYKDRLTNKECTQEVKDNLTILLSKINALLTELGIKHVDITSGFRPSEVNIKTPGAAKKSYHQKGMAIDIATHEVYNLLKAKPELLKKYSLWMESELDAPTWTHLDMGTRSDRPLRIFHA